MTDKIIKLPVKSSCSSVNVQSQCAIGTTGIQGPVGPAGARGIQGIQGVPGRDGDSVNMVALLFAAGSASGLTGAGAGYTAVSGIVGPEIAAESAVTTGKIATQALATNLRTDDKITAAFAASWLHIIQHLVWV